MTELTKMNKYVYDKFLKANKEQKLKMLIVLREQTDNLNILLLMMEKEYRMVL